MWGTIISKYWTNWSPLTRSRDWPWGGGVLRLRYKARAAKLHFIREQLGARSERLLQLCRYDHVHLATDYIGDIRCRFPCRISNNFGFKKVLVLCVWYWHFVEIIPVLKIRCTGCRKHLNYFIFVKYHCNYNKLLKICFKQAWVTAYRSLNTCKFLDHSEIRILKH